MEAEETVVKKGSDAEDSDRETEQKEKKADGSQVVLSPTSAAQIGSIDHP